MSSAPDGRVVHGRHEVAVSLERDRGLGLREVGEITGVGHAPIARHAAAVCAQWAHTTFAAAGWSAVSTDDITCLGFRKSETSALATLATAMGGALLFPRYGSIGTMPSTAAKLCSTSKGRHYPRLAQLTPPTTDSPRHQKYQQKKPTKHTPVLPFHRSFRYTRFFTPQNVWVKCGACTIHTKLNKEMEIKICTRMHTPHGDKK